MAYDQFTTSVMIKVAKSDPRILSRVRRDNDLFVVHQVAHQVGVFHPLIPVKMPAPSRLLVTHQDGRVSVLAYDAKLDASRSHFAVGTDVDQGRGKRGLLPFLGFRQPDPRGRYVLITDADVQETIRIDVHDSDTIIFPIGATQRLPQQQVLVDTLDTLLKV